VTVDAVNAFVRERLGENNRASLLFVPKAEGESEALPSDELAAGIASAVES